MANVNEAKEGLSKSVALSPGVLKEALQSAVAEYLPTLLGPATRAEVINGVSNRAVTPASLKSALPSLVTEVPVGTVITHAGPTAPVGYMSCDGSLLSRVTYKALFQVIGTTYGIGDGSTTFKLPEVTGGTFNSYIKF